MQFSKFSRQIIGNFKSHSRVNFSHQGYLNLQFNNQTEIYAPLRVDNSQFRSYFIYPGPKSLDTILDIQKFENESPEMQKYIWLKRYSESYDTIGETLSDKQYHVWIRRVASNRHFIIPVDKGLGYVNMYCQQQDNYTLITNLRDYKEKGQSATPYISMQHFPEFMNKGLVLVRAEVDTRWIDKLEAATVVRVLHKFYCEDKLFDYVETFNKRPHEFNYNKFLEACKQAKLVVRDQERDYEQGLKERPKDPSLDFKIDLDKLFKKW